MIICKYQKIGAAAYIPHLDILRGFCMAIRRAGLKVAYSEGFNPHMILYFAQPMPLGTQSQCEYMAAASDEAPEIFQSKINEKLSANLRVLKAAHVETNPNIAGLAHSALYEIKGLPLEQKQLDFILNSSPYEVTYQNKQEQITKDVRPLIKNLYKKGDAVYAHLCCGNQNLRPDRLFCHENYRGVFSVKDMDICKKIMYTVDKGEDVDMDALFFGAEK